MYVQAEKTKLHLAQNVNFFMEKFKTATRTGYKHLTALCIQNTKYKSKYKISNSLEMNNNKKYGEAECQALSV